MINDQDSVAELPNEEGKVTSPNANTTTTIPERGASVSEKGDVETTTDTADTQIDLLKRQLEAAQQASDESRDRALRAQAEIENMRRRMEQEVVKAQKFAIERFARDLLDVIDSLELGIQAGMDAQADVARLREGNTLIHKQFLTVLERFNVITLEPLGQKFNPELHQAMAVERVDNTEPNTVLKVFQKGYLLNDRLLRPATVVIAATESTAHVDERA